MPRNVSPTLLRLCLRALSRPARDLLRHLAACPQCGVLSFDEPAADEPEAGAPDEHAYDPAFSADRVLRRAHLERFREQRLAGLVEDLLAQPPDRWKECAAAQVDLYSPPGIRAVLARVEEVLEIDPRLALLRTRLALSILDDLEIAQVVHEPLRVRVLTLLGVVLGRLGEDEPAREAFAEASRLLPDCLDGDEDATLLRCQAALLERKGRPSEALALLAREAWIAGELGDAAAEIAALRSGGLLYFQMGHTPQALGWLTWALFVAETRGASATANDLRHQLAWLLLAEDDVAAAREMFGDNCPEPLHCAQVPVLIRLLTQDSLARAALVRLRRELRAAHAGRDAFQAATAAILLARHYVRTGDRAQLRPLAPYVRAAAAAGQLAVPSRAALERLALALGESDVSIPILVQTAHALRYLDEDDGPEAAPDRVH